MKESISAKKIENENVTTDVYSVGGRGMEVGDEWHNGGQDVFGMSEKIQ